MIVHVVLFGLKPGLTDADRNAVREALATAAREIPSVKNLRVGRRVKHSLPGYEQTMTDDYEFAVIIEFDTIQGVKDYLQHPAHAAAGHHFTASLAKALAYDYEISDSLLSGD